MTVNTLTLYMPGSSVGIQAPEGGQLHQILVSMGANSIPSAPGETVRADPFPQYVDDAELTAALAAYTPGGGGGAVDSVNGQTGAVVLTSSDVGAVADTDPRLSDARTPTTHTHGVTDLTASGTKDATTFLRGDNTWATAPGGSPTYANLPAGSTITVQKSGGTWPVRPTSRTDIAVAWKGADPSPAIGGTGMVDGVDYRLVTP